MVTSSLVTSDGVAVDPDIVSTYEVVDALPDVRVTAIDSLCYQNELPELEEHNSGRKLLSHENFYLLKARIKQWHSETKTSDRVTKHDNLQLIKYIEEKIKAIFVNDDYRDSRIKLLQEVERLDTFESFDLFPKARVKWDIESDENSKFFHGLIKKKRRAQMIHDHDSNVDFPPFANSSGLCDLDRNSLKTCISLDEVKNAVWDCGSSKAPGPDGFSFAFMKKYWDYIKVDTLEYVNIFLDTGLPHRSNFYFFTLIPKGVLGLELVYPHPGLLFSSTVVLPHFYQIWPQARIPAGSVVPTGKDNSIVSTGSTKVIPAGRTILFLVVYYSW
ncbi:hypothetical protein Tco_1059134 [Tanacetum coccineum]